MTVKKTDVVYLEYLPAIGTQIRINTEIKGTISGFDFHQALMKIWPGEQPGDWSLKDTLPGN